jgi:GNAT acetyltransferase-like protein
MRVEMELRSDAWSEELERLPLSCRDTYFTPGYHGLHAASGDGAPVCSMIEEGSRRLLIPGLRVPIEDTGRQDLQTCNGYGGPLASEGADRSFLDQAWARWREAAAHQGIVAGFFRLHPLLGNERWLPADACVVSDRPTVLLELTTGVDALWREATTRHRNVVGKARREGRVVAWGTDEDWRAFASFYGGALERLRAPERLRFAPSYFERLRLLPGARLAAVRDDAGLAAAAVFLAGPLWYHYHLSARRPDAGNHLASLILQDALEKAAGQGLRAMHLGGGRTPSAEDTLLAFKKALGGRLLDFKVALVVVDPEAYSGLLDAWRAETGRAPEWLLGYRQPKAAVAEAR